MFQNPKTANRDRLWAYIREALLAEGFKTQTCINQYGNVGSR